MYTKTDGLEPISSLADGFIAGIFVFFDGKPTSECGVWMV